MEIKDVKFLKGVTGSEGLPKPELPTVAFFGRSNVGKSSVINALVRRKDVARSSSRPGRTTEINYFLVDDSWHLADTPGYGYARLPKIQMEKIAQHLSWFAGAAEVRITLAAVVIDAERGMQDSDRETIDVLRDAGRDVLILANKADKGRRNDVSNHIRQAKEDFPDARVIRYSSKTGEGRQELLGALLDSIAHRG
ncbi:MAG TPA: ribosome biogenesis GTP-binding protein YihA/YsxC [Candidatus Fimivivens sp.]|nr:ribosome biogenesis GTP-binding protein YihA/YsxC [Candidatus Fimivivens sp.]